MIFDVYYQTKNLDLIDEKVKMKLYNFRSDSDNFLFTLKLVNYVGNFSHFSHY